MTPASTDPRPGAGAPPRRGRVEEVTVVLLTRVDGPALLEVLDALAAQRRLPHRLLVTGLDPDGEEVAQAREHPLVTEQGVSLEARPPLVPTRDESDAGRPAAWRVLEDARGALPVSADHWLWLLSDDSVPGPGALEALVGAVRRSARVGVVGPKLVRLDDPRLLVGVGHHVTVGGRAADSRRDAALDQGQLDLRQDVLGTPLPGSLVRSDVLEQAGGLDPAFDDGAVAGLDLGWRSHLLGHRVVMAPDAVVRQGRGGLGADDPRTARVRRRQLALARGSWWSSPWRALGIALTSALAALLLLLVKRPREAGDEWADVRAVLAPWRGLGARRRFRGRRVVRPRDLTGLFVPSTSGWRSVGDSVGEALDPRRDARERPARRAPGGTETGPVAEELAELEGRERSGTWSWPLALALAAAAALTAWRWRDLAGPLAPGGAGVAGGELGPASTDARGLWRSALDGWRGGGLGGEDPAEPWLLPLSVLARLVEAVADGFAPATAGVALGWLLLVATPASVLTAYLSLRRVTRRRWLRAGLGLAWAGLPPLTVATGEGRVGPVVVHVLAPLLLAGYAVCADRRGGPRRTAALFATVLGVLAAAQWVPLVLLVATLGGAALVVLGRGRARWRGVALAVLPWLLMLPWLPAVADAPVRLLGGAGATVASAAFPEGAPAWQTLLLAAGPGVDPTAPGPAAVALWLTAPLWAAAAGALLLGGRTGRRAGVLLGAAVVLVAAAMLAPRLALGWPAEGSPEQGQVVTAWPGTLLSLAAAAVLLGAGAGLDALLGGAGRRLSRRRARAEREELAGTPSTVSRAGVLVPALAVAAGALVVVAGASTLALAPVGPGRLGVATDPLPAVASEQAAGPSGLRILVLDPVDDSGDEPPADAAGPTAVQVLRADLRGAEPEPARMLRDRTGELAAGLPAPGRVEEAARVLAGGGDPAQALAALEELAVGYVLVHADERDELVGAVDRVPGLSRVSSPEGQVLWRMTANEAARVRVVGPDGSTLQRLDATGPHGRAAGTVVDLPAGSTLHVAEGQGWQRQAAVEVDGSPVVVQAGGRAALPEGTFEVVVDVRTPGLAWHLVAAVLAAVTAFLALPVGRVEDEPEEDVR